MKHLEEAHDKFGGTDLDYIEVNTADHSVKFTIQNGPIKEVGVNGIQAAEMLRFVRELFVSLNDSYPCLENEGAINSIDTAMVFQDLRTRDREARKVEGLNEL